MNTPLHERSVEERVAWFEANKHNITTPAANSMLAIMVDQAMSALIKHDRNAEVPLNLSGHYEESTANEVIAFVCSHIKERVLKDNLTAEFRVNSSAVSDRDKCLSLSLKIEMRRAA